MQAAPKTARGRATRERIEATASELIAERGVAETSLDDVIARAGVSKSQLYHYFEDRPSLLRAVVAYNADKVLRALGPFESWKAIRTAFDSMVDLQVARRAYGGCPIGSLVGQLAEADDSARLELSDAFARWQTLLQDGLEAMQARGKLVRRADPEALAVATLAAIQGGLLLTQTRRDPNQLAIALDAAYDHLRSYAA